MICFAMSTCQLISFLFFIETVYDRWDWKRFNWLGLGRCKGFRNLALVDRCKEDWLRSWLGLSPATRGSTFDLSSSWDWRWRISDRDSRHLLIPRINRFCSASVRLWHPRVSIGWPVGKFYALIDASSGQDSRRCRLWYYWSVYGWAHLHLWFAERKS